MKLPSRGCPCKGCTDRFVTEETRCHSSCEKYKAWVQIREDARAAHAEECKIDGVMFASANRAKRKKERKARYSK